MKGKAILLVLVAVLLVGGYLATRNQAKPQDQSQTQNQEGQMMQEKQGQGQPFSGTLKAAVALGIPMKCSYEVEGNQMEGVIKGQNYAGKMQMEGKTGNVIIKDNCMWSWEDETKQGITTCFEPTETEESIWDNPNYENPNVTYNCMPTVVTEATFTPPTDVKFMDLQQMMQNPEDYMGL